MGRFRDRMDEELRIRGYSASTRECYLRCVRHFVRHFMAPPDRLAPEQVRQYQLYLTRDCHVSWSYFNQVVCALRFFYRRIGTPRALALVVGPTFTSGPSGPAA